MKKKVSCHIITYNQIAYISQCIDSVLMQKRNFPIEIVIGDDNSTDGTQELLREYKHKYPDIIKLNLREVRGTGLPGKQNFLTTLALCTGDYIALCEGDDYWTDQLKLQKQFDILEANPHLGGCFHNSEERYWNDYSKASSLYLSFPAGREFSIQELTQYNMVPTASVVFKTPIPDELFSKEFLTLPVGDWPLHLLNTRNGNYYYIPQVMSVRNLNPQSIWGMQDHKKNVAQVVYVYSELIDSGWFKKEVVDLLKIGCENLENSIKPQKTSEVSNFKNRLRSKIIRILTKLS